MLKKTLLLSILGLIIFFNLVSKANAVKGVSVTPSIAHIDLATDAPQYQLTFTNNFDSDIILNLSAKDFTELEDNYRIDFLSDTKAKDYKYSLSSWISFENRSLELLPGEKKSVIIYIDKERITKGGHYASIMAEIMQPKDTKGINIKAVLSSLLFVRASTGKEVEEGKIILFEPTRSGIEYPDSFLMQFQNSGNVHVVPYGSLKIYDPLGNLTAKASVNEDSLDALPESIRSYRLKINAVQRVLLPGNYAAELDIHFGKTNQKLKTRINFFSQGSFDFVKIGIGVIIGIIVLIIIRKKLKNKR